MSCRLFSFLVLLGWSSVAVAQPAVTRVSLRGLQIGATTTLAFDGAGLLPDPVLVSSTPLAAQKVRPGATVNRVEIEITLGPQTTPGIASLRLANAGGISDAIIVGVDRLPQQPLTPSVSQLPVALHGELAGSQIQRVPFAAAKGTPIVVDVESQRLGGALRPVVRVYNARGAQLAWSPPSYRIGGDARCQFVVPVDGEYTVELHDLLYQAASPGFFRLKIGSLQFADFVLPLAATAGQTATLRPVGSLPESTEIPFTSAVVGPRPVPLAVNDLTGAAPNVLVVDQPELLEQPLPAGQRQELPPAPVGVSGRIASGEEDAYTLAVVPGSKLRIEVQARAVGSPLDGVLILRAENGGQLATNDDQPNSPDPALDFTVPANTNKIVVAVRDMLNRGGSDFVYRLAIRDASRPDFSATLPTGRILVPSGGTQVVPVQIARAGYTGPIRLSVSGLPAGVQAAGDTIPAGADIGLLTLSAPAGTTAFSLGVVEARSADPAISLTRTALAPDSPAARSQRWLRSEIGVAVTSPAPIGLEWVSFGAAEEKFVVGSKVAANVRLSRAAGVTGQTRVRLLTTQTMPKKTVKVNNKDQTVDDVEKAIRLEADGLFPPEKTDATVTVVLPADLPKTEFGVVLVAELLGADGKTVVTSVAAPARKFTPSAAAEKPAS